MNSPAFVILFSIATYLNINPAVEGVCQARCLPNGAMSKMFCFESFDYAYCAYQATINGDCWSELKEKAQRVLAQLNQAGEFQRCGYNLDPSSKTGFSFDESRSELKICYDFYQQPPASGADPCTRFYNVCWKDSNPSQNLNCNSLSLMLSCAASAITHKTCRKTVGRNALNLWRKYKETGEFDRCGLGYDPTEEFVASWIENEHNPMCYNLSAGIRVSYSTNGQQNTALKERFWIMMVALGIITAPYIV
ncbi:uncharacterized protein LOC131944587 [Physella acuta]|uniref:uncharacterized protein LOC131944587 n=1 Tax=Physella acuta TaxID=109671 RepID=UPI0027DB7868|nr:uncharacterized protein LOC131944587 [Physella acuta]